VSWKPKHQTTAQWYNPQAFTKPADGTFGNVRRNSLYGPGFQSINLSGGKTFTLPWEGISMQVRADAGNGDVHDRGVHRHDEQTQAAGDQDDGLAPRRQLSCVHTTIVNLQPLPMQTMWCSRHAYGASGHPCRSSPARCNRCRSDADAQSCSATRASHASAQSSRAAGRVRTAP